MPEPTPAQIAEWENFVSYFDAKLGPKLLRLKAIAEVSSRLQTLLNSIGADISIFDKDDASEVDAIFDLYNRMSNSINKVKAETYGVNFINGDIDIMAPAHFTNEQIMEDEIIIHEPMGAVGLIIIGVGMIVIGGALKVSEHIERRETLERQKLQLKLGNLLKNSGNMAPHIAEAIKKFALANKPAIEQAGIGNLLFGEHGKTMIAAAIGIGILLFAFMQGRK